MATKSVLITGCSLGGIGDALAQCFHRHGLHVFATARNLAKIEHLKAMGMTVLQLDVVDEKSIREATQSVSDITGGTLDFLVNNSGLAYHMPLLDVDIPTAKTVFDINVFGVLRCIQAFAPLLIAAKGTIINISSIGGHVGPPWLGAYSASKAALNMLSETLRYEVQPLGVKVINVNTGAVASNIGPNQPAFHLPPTSYYNILKSLIEPFLTSEWVNEFNISADSYADQVVRNALRERPNLRPWVGGRARFNKFMGTVCGWWFYDFAFGHKFGLFELEKAWKAKEKNE